jgi:hypothetical protein
MAVIEALQSRAKVGIDEHVAHIAVIEEARRRASFRGGAVERRSRIDRATPSLRVDAPVAITERSAPLASEKLLREDCLRIY